MYSANLRSALAAMACLAGLGLLLDRVAAEDQAPAPSRVRGKWVKLLDAQEREQEYPHGYAFQSGTWDANRKRWYSLEPTAKGGVWTWDEATKLFSHDPADRDNDPGEAAHNFSCAYDSINDLVWFIGPAVKIGSYHWKPGANQWTRWSAGETPLSFDPIMGFDEKCKAVYATGGWNNPQAVYKLVVDPLPADGAQWQKLGEDGPDLVKHDLLRETNARGGWDPAKRALWVIDGASDYWTFAVEHQTWTRLATTGDKPPLCTAYALADGFVVGISCYDQGEGETADARPPKSFTLNVGSGQWTVSAEGDAAPPVSNYYAITWLGDPKGTFITQSGSQLWRFEISAPPRKSE